MPLPPKPRPWPPRALTEPEPPAEDADVSEFLSEDSDEFKAVHKPATTAAPAAAPRPAPAPVSGHGPNTVATPPDPPGEAPPSLRGVESGPVVLEPETKRSIPWGWLVAAMAIAVMAVAWPFLQDEQASPVATLPSSSSAVEGSATIISRPEGAEVWINSVRRGVTPLRLSLPVGNHTLELRNGGAQRSLTLTVEAATAVREVIDLPVVANAGGIEVSTDLAGARVAVDGTVRGVTPLTLNNIAPGVHSVTVSAGGRTVARSVTVTAGATTSVMASLVPTGSAGGWVSIAAPFEMQVRENGQIVGTTGANRLMLPAGAHQLELVSEPYGFRTIISATVEPGRTVPVPVTVPNGRLSINAQPWADVWLDGRALGATPLANVTVPIGPHDLVFRHPELGERQLTVRVATGTPTRATVDFAVAR